MFAAHGGEPSGADGPPRPVRDAEPPATGFEEVVLEDPAEALKRARAEAEVAARDAEGVTRSTAGPVVDG
jgi:hypothetical protein